MLEQVRRDAGRSQGFLGGTSSLTKEDLVVVLPAELFWLH